MGRKVDRDGTISDAAVTSVVELSIARARREWSRTWVTDMACCDDAAYVGPKESTTAVSRCISPTGEGPVPVSAGAPGSRPQVTGETLRPSGVSKACEAARAAKPGSKHAGPQHEVKPAASKEKLRVPSRSCHGEGHDRNARIGAREGTRRGTGRSTRARRDAKNGRPVSVAQVRARRRV